MSCFDPSSNESPLLTITQSCTKLCWFMHPAVAYTLVCIYVVGGGWHGIYSSEDTVGCAWLGIELLGTVYFNNIY